MIITLNLVKRTVYKSLRQGEIGDYVDMLLESAQGPAFEPFQTILSDLAKKKTDFTDALAKTQNGGKPATIVKTMPKNCYTLSLIPTLMPLIRRLLRIHP